MSFIVSTTTNVDNKQKETAFAKNHFSNSYYEIASKEEGPVLTFNEVCERLKKEHTGSALFFELTTGQIDEPEKYTYYNHEDETTYKVTQITFDTADKVARFVSSPCKKVKGLIATQDDIIDGIVKDFVLKCTEFMIKTRIGFDLGAEIF